MGLANPDDGWWDRLVDRVKTGFEEYNQAKSEIIPGIVWDLWGAEELLADPSKGRVSNMFSNVFSRLNREMSGAMKPLQSAMEVPVLGDILWAWDRVQTYGIRRPLTTNMLLQAQLGGEGYSDDPDFFESVRRAWNASERVTPGQAIAWNLLAVGGEDEAKYNPMTPEGRKNYYEDPLFQGVSGSFDFSLSFVDPVAAAWSLGKSGLKGAAGQAAQPGLLGKTGLAAEKVVSKTGMAPTQKMIEGGFLEREVMGPGLEMGQAPHATADILTPNYKRVFDSANTESLAKFNRLRFNEGAFGPTAGTVIWSAARTGDEALFAEAVLAARGSYPALRRLQTDHNAMALANAIGRQRQALNISAATANYGTQPAAKVAVDAMVEQQFQAWVQDFARQLQAPDEFGRPSPDSFWGGFHQSLAGQGIIRAHFMDKLRVGLHDYGTAFAPTVMGRIGRNPLRLANPSARYDSLINDNAPNSFRNFRYNVDRSALSQAEKDALVGRYMLAATAEQRSALVEYADELAVRRGLEVRNVPRDWYEPLLADLKQHRRNAVSMLQMSSKHMPTAFRKEADKALKAGRVEDAKRHEAVAKEWEAAVARGEAPETLNAVPVGDAAHLGLIDQGAEGTFTADRPFFRSTTANWSPMTDYRALDQALRRWMAPKMRAQARLMGLENVPGNHIADLLNSKTYQLQGTLGAGLQSLQQVWSIAAILRPAQFIRSMSDDMMRAMTWHGMLPYMTTGSKGVARLGSRAVKQGVPWAMEKYRRTAAYLRGKPHVVDMPELDISDIEVQRAPSEAPGFYQVVPRTSDPAMFHRDPDGNIFAIDAPTFEEAVAKGLMPGEFYLEAVMHAYEQGAVTWDLAAIVEQYNRKLITENQFNRAVYEYALDQAGVSSYTNPSWQRDFRDAVVANKGGVIADPLTAGTVKTPSAAKLNELYESGPVSMLAVDPRTGAYDIDGFYDFISQHAKQVVEENFQVHGVRVASGDIKLSLVRPRGAPRTVAARMTREQRKAMQAGIRRVGQQDLNINAGGVPGRIRGVFAGMEGNFTRDTISSTNQLGSAYQNLINLKNTTRNSIKASELKDYAPGDEGYGAAWEYTVNQLVANDAVARQALEGKPFAEVLNWTDTVDGRAWVKARQQNGVDTAEHVSAAMNTALRLVPEFGDLRARALAHDASYTALQDAIPILRQRPDVLGQADALAMGGHPVSNWVKKKLDGWFRVMSDMPIDQMVRYPFMQIEYERAVRPLLDSYNAHVQKTGEPWLQSEADRLSQIARMQTLDTAQLTLYDTAGRYDAATAMQYMMPFSNAIADAYFKWARIAWKKPVETVGQWHRYINAPERMGLVYDDEGNHLSYDEDGREVWTSPMTGERAKSDAERRAAGEAPRSKYVLMRVPSEAGKQLISKGDVKWFEAFNKDSMNPILSLPSFGPIVAVPMNKLALSYPELADNQFMKTFVLPFGPTDESVASQVTPGLIRSAQKWLFENQDLAGSTAYDVYQTWAIEAERDGRPMPSFDEAKAEAKNELGLRFLASAVSPVSIQYWSPYKAQIDAWHQLVRKHGGDETDAMVEFREKYADEFRWVTAHVSKTNVSIPATVAGYKKFLANEELVRANPDIAGLITGGDGAGAFNKARYEWEKTIRINGKPLREVQPVEDSFAEVEKRDTWAEYTKLMNLIDNEMERRGLSNLQQRGARDLAAMKQSWIKSKKKSERNPNQMSEWYREYFETDAAKMESRLIQMRNVLADKRLVDGRPDLQKLQEYVSERDHYRKLMAGYGYATLSSRKSKWLKDRWTRYVQQLKGSNLAFADVYDRWLTRDTLADPGTLEEEVW